eukprot:s885_g13.t1
MGGISMPSDTATTDSVDDGPAPRPDVKVSGVTIIVAGASAGAAELEAASSMLPSAFSFRTAMLSFRPGKAVRKGPGYRGAKEPSAAAVDVICAALPALPFSQIHPGMAAIQTS